MPRCHGKSPTVKDAYQQIPGLISLHAHHLHRVCLADTHTALGPSIGVHPIWFCDIKTCNINSHRALRTHGMMDPDMLIEQEMHL